MKFSHKILSSMLTLLFLGAFANGAMAQNSNEGFDFRGGISADIARLSYVQEVVKRDDERLVGFSANLSFGYRWKYVGFYLDQDFGGVWINYSNEIYRDGSSWFVGGTYVVARGIYPLLDNMQVDLGFGLGVMYTSGDQMRLDFGSDHKFPILYNDDLDPSAAFALRLGLAFTYYMYDNIGFGIHFNYGVGFKHHKYNVNNNDVTSIGKSELADSFNHEYTEILHNMDPGAHIVVRF